DYTVYTKGQPLDDQAMKEQYNDDINNETEVKAVDHKPNQYNMLLTWAAHQKMINSGLTDSIKPVLSDALADPAYALFPYVPSLNWALDNYGPLWIPAKGATLTLTAAN